MAEVFENTVFDVFSYQKINISASFWYDIIYGITYCDANLKYKSLLKCLNSNKHDYIEFPSKENLNQTSLPLALYWDLEKGVEQLQGWYTALFVDINGISHRPEFRPEMIKKLVQAIYT